uniref:Programmed cell death protein 6 n=1 Tax=Rhabditophanes sp. KR3021 TaxID=114890 RepID=A0AC35TMC3_9BILA
MSYYGNPAQMPMPNLQQIFANVDKDRSGKITALELQQALSNGTQSEFNPETCRLMIGMFDIDGDGAISFTEFQSLWKYINDWTACFRSFDTDNSGNIDKKELTTALTQFGYRLSDSFYSLLMLKFSRTGNNAVNFDDFVQLSILLQILSNSFAQKDMDRDGIITVHYEEFLMMVFSIKM